MWGKSKAKTFFGFINCLSHVKMQPWFELQASGIFLENYSNRETFCIFAEEQGNFCKMWSCNMTYIDETILICKDFNSVFYYFKTIFWFVKPFFCIYTSRFDFRTWGLALFPRYNRWYNVQSVCTEQLRLHLFAVMDFTTTQTTKVAESLQTLQNRPGCVRDLIMYLSTSTSHPICNAATRFSKNVPLA